MYEIQGLTTVLCGCERDAVVNWSRASIIPELAVISQNFIVRRLKFHIYFTQMVYAIKLPTFLTGENCAALGRWTPGDLRG